MVYYLPVSEQKMPKSSPLPFRRREPFTHGKRK
jgi:hypothetical protein